MKKTLVNLYIAAVPVIIAGVLVWCSVQVY